MNDNLKKKQNNIALTIFIVGIILITSVVLSYITTMTLSSDKGSTKKYTASFLTSEIVKKMNYDNLSEISTGNISKYYDIPDGVVEDSSMYISTRSDNFTEIACFRLSSEDKQDELIVVINDYISEKTKTYQNVNDKAYSMVSASKTDISYPYVFVAIAPDSEAAVSAFESLISDDTSE